MKSNVRSGEAKNRFLLFLSDYLDGFDINTGAVSQHHVEEHYPVKQ